MDYASGGKSGEIVNKLEFGNGFGGNKPFFKQRSSKAYPFMEW